MRPGSRDIKVTILIAGEELTEIKNYTYHMVEAFGLDSRFERYQGIRPIGFYRWDLECLIDVIELVLRDSDEDANHRGNRALRGLLARLQNEYRSTYGILDGDDGPSASRTVGQENVPQAPNKGAAPDRGHGAVRAKSTGSRHGRGR